MGWKVETFSSFIFFKHGIHFRHPCSHVHQQHGCVEQKHRHVVKCGLTLLAYAKLPLYFWWEAFYATNFLINKLPTFVLHMSYHYHKLFGTLIDYVFSNLLVVLVFLIFMSITPISLPFTLRSVFSLGVVMSIRGINTLIHLNEFILHPMLYLIKLIFLFPLFPNFGITISMCSMFFPCSPYLYPHHPPNILLLGPLL